ncbi:16S rRNA (guanine(966)-N(2))-methyltransferase RsmD [Acetobacterium sp.]|jgi:16S rRNA (guanine966-N2)-methyltransferase|uniref:16S rRNA (guanine(966)-N(2))-methyltransferase RsmD n=1 Tax=Acetobacterium sp. TaxID=1872094 RepID=UPI002720F151|nr:16S rRNA (guanine(966)-N(2))-methyltransferase RsmD [Acetobacterium sp.]MDO9491674.1 16S rRNA (guanine(966)-N(2))-methyltransferase RsmD [Acetobacterium sp.]
MRIIAGEKRGKKLVSITGDRIRPTADKIKGAIFNSLQNEIRAAAVFADLFSGTGAMGLEALSRGVALGYFFDLSNESIQTTKKNISLLGYENRTRVFNQSARSGVEMLAHNKVQCDIIFMDPPYCQVDEIYQLLEIISEKEILSENGKLVIETEKSVIMPLVKNKLTCYKSKKYGITTISYYSRENYEHKNCSLPREF